MVTINDNRSYSCKKFEDIPTYEYFMCNKNLYIKIPTVMIDSGCAKLYKNAIRINYARTFIFIEDDYLVEPVDLYITINSPIN